MPRAPKAAPAKAAPKLLKTKTMAATADAATEWQAKAKKTEAKKAVAAAAASKKASSESRRAAVATGKKAKAAESAKKAKVAAAVRARADGAPALSYKQLTAEAVLALGGRSASLASIKKHILANHPSAGIVPAALFNKHVSSALAKLVQDGAFKRDANSYSTADGKQAKAIAAGGGEKKAAAAATTKKTTTTTTATKKAAPKKTAAASDDAEEVATVAMITGPPDPTKTYAYGDATAYCYHDVSSTFFVQCVNSEGQAMTTKPPGVPGLAAYLVRIRDNSGRVNCTMSWDTPFPGYYKMTYPPLNTWTDNYWLYVTYLGANCKDVPYFVATYRGGLNDDGTVASASPYSDRRIPRALMTAGTATEAPRPIGEYLKRLTMKSAAWAATSKNYFAAAGQKVPPPAVPKKKGGTVLAPMAMPYPSSCYAYGSEYYLSWTDIPSQFWVQGYDANGNPPSPTAGNRLQIRIWSIYGSYVKVLYSTKCDANGVYTFNIPGLPCENFFYQIYFEGFSNKIQDQPFVHYVDNPPPSSAAKSATPSRKGAATTTTSSSSSSSSSATADDAQIYGPNADKCVAGEDSTIFVHLTDASSAPLKSGGAAVTARFKRAGAGGTWTAVDVTDQKNGGYRLSYVIADAGNYTLQVLLNGSAVKGSPLSIECTEAGAVGSKRSKASASPAKKPKASAAKKVKVTAGADASPKKKAAPKKAASPKKKAATSPKKKAAPKKK